ncbi:DNA-binding transcriptional LysR family regulator [Azospirillum fermentarium]|uniref:LysR family transcriptional regulator n=1 Tax=Azospirillum fermentarium TaxID=1233114 RepID=UPI0022263A97|nr:LysR family transcriptional regulator [Azospirillum fermentarium]MCW2248816.1 DNA-binding transcriptional LysR family regulator [Azospirillum fermentarium]
MDTIWLEDFLAVAEWANFSRAAEHRNVTQPALSRRVKALEDWVGAPLFDRATHRITLTEAGERFRPVAEDTLRRLHQGREDIRALVSTAAATVTFASTHALALTYFPAWLRAVEDAAPEPLSGIRLVADTMQACERIMLQGQAQFLLCHHHPAAPGRLDGGDFRSLTLGADTLVPVCAPDGAGAPRHPLPGGPGQPVAHLSYSDESGMGRIAEAARGTMEPRPCLETVFTSHVAVLLKTMALDGRGLAWLPLSLVQPDLVPGGGLVRAGDGRWDIPITIRLFRPRARLSPVAERFWERLKTGPTY